MNNSFNEQRYSMDMPTPLGDQPRINFILENIPDKKLKILDIGCWSGSYAVRYKKTSNTVYAIESSKSAAKKAREKKIFVKEGNFLYSDCFPEVSFDIVVAGEIIEHVFDTDLFIDKINKKLKKNGLLILTTPNVASLPRRVLLLLGINPLLEYRNIPKVTAGHVRYFTFKNIEDLLLAHDFGIEKEASDVVNFNNRGTCYSTLIPKIFKSFGRSIMLVGRKVKNT